MINVRFLSFSVLGLVDIETPTLFKRTPEVCKFMSCEPNILVFQMLAISRGCVSSIRVVKLQY